MWGTQLHGHKELNYDTMHRTAMKEMYWENQPSLERGMKKMVGLTMVPGNEPCLNVVPRTGLSISQAPSQVSVIIPRHQQCNRSPSQIRKQNFD